MVIGKNQSVAKKIAHVTKLRWSFFIGILSFYLVIHFAQILPYASEIFSNIGILPEVKDLPTYPFFPNILFLFDDPLSCYALVCFSLLASILLLFNKWQSIAALLLWYFWACLLTRNPFIRNPGMPYVGWVLLAIAIISWWNQPKDNRSWSVPAPIFWWAWALLGLGYSLSGIHKLGSPSWQDGSALFYLLENPLSRPGFIASLLQALPPILLKIQTWLVLALELLSFPLMLISLTRPWIWLALSLMHVGIMLSVDFVDLTMGMLIIHLFVFDERWLKPKAGSAIILFDGVCNLCDQFISLLVDVADPATIKIAALQSEAAQNIIDNDKEYPDSIIYFSDGKFLYYSDAVIATGKSIGGFFRLIAEVLSIFPKPLRDIAYRWVARHRYKLFGKKETCRLPTEYDQKFFLN